jgi:DNA/RNA-binding domain of Phe-tRNA-synthetase-like protein
VHFAHSSEIWRDFPELVPGVLAADGITPNADVGSRVATLTAIAESRLASSHEAELPEIQAWRRAFSKMGLKPTQYRCASEALLRRFRRERSLPSIHPLVDLCNAVSMAFAIPVAAFDTSRIASNLVVRHAAGDETFSTFSGELERPAAGEVIFADADRRAHARRWTNRQSAFSAVRDGTSSVLIVAEALHGPARSDVEMLVATLAEEIAANWSGQKRTAILSASSPRFLVRADEAEYP